MTTVQKLTGAQLWSTLEAPAMETRRIKFRDLVKPYVFYKPPNDPRGARLNKWLEVIGDRTAWEITADGVVQFLDALVRFAQSLKEEEERHVKLGFTEDELEIYDTLSKNNMTPAEEKKVRMAAKALIDTLTVKSPRVLVQDWFKDRQTRLTVRDKVGEVLDELLPEEGYDKALFIQKRDQVFDLTLDLAINHQKWAA